MNSYNNNIVPYNPSVRPIGVTVLAVLTYIGGTLMIISGLFLLIVGVEFFHQASKFSRIFDIRIGGEVLILISLLYVGLGIFEYILGTGLLKLKNWARITVIVFTSIQLFLLFIYLFFAIKALPLTAIPFLLFLISLGINIWVLVYLNINVVRAAFSSPTQHTPYSENYRQYQPEEAGINFKSKSVRSFGDVQIVRGTMQGKHFNLVEGKNYIGRDPSCSIYLPDPEKYVSRKHCVIICKPNVVGIIHLSEKGSTYVNSEKIFKKKLFSGDEIKAGKYVLRIVTP